MPGATHTLGRPHITFRNCGIFAKLFAQVEKFKAIFSYCRKVCTSVFCTGKRSNFDLVYSRKIYSTLFLQRDTMFMDILSAEKHADPSKSKLWVTKILDLFCNSICRIFAQFL
jgi:hypothetical protein